MLLHLGDNNISYKGHFAAKQQLVLRLVAVRANALTSQPKYNTTESCVDIAGITFFLGRSSGQQNIRIS